ncbi:MAG: DUF4070 domain-containing protein, partial [Desulfobacterales bacterium]|nr:DUF4070 domain-containing protein [Desulfobacterales bacterium]
NWRGPISIVDDNFIGNKKEIKNNLLKTMREWMQIHKYPFEFTTQATINLADDEELMSLMIATGINSTFIGIETPDEISLHNCNKVQNINRDMLQSVKKMQKAGFQVSAGFIVGFDSDTPTVFQRQIDFIQQSGIVTAMIGLLNAPKNTKLYQQLENENRLTIEATGNNTDLTMNFIPRMDYKELLDGYKRIIHDIYATKPYYERLRQHLLNYNRLYTRKKKISFPLLIAFFKSIFIIGFLNKGRFEYWKLIIWTLINRPGLFVEAITNAVYGYHFRKVYGLEK